MKISKKGVALVIVIGLVIVLAILTLLILLLATGHYHGTAYQIKSAKAYYLAEGGIQDALWAIRTGNLVQLPTPGNPTTYYLNVDNDPGTERTGGNPGEETLVSVYDIADYAGIHPGAPTPPADVLYFIDSTVDTGDIPAK